MGVKGSMGKCKVQRRVEKRGTQRRVGDGSSDTTEGGRMRGG